MVAVAASPWFTHLTPVDAADVTPTAVALILEVPATSRYAVIVQSPSASVTEVFMPVPAPNKSPAPPVNVQRIPAPEGVLSALRTVAV